MYEFWYPTQKDDLPLLALALDHAYTETLAQAGPEANDAKAASTAKAALEPNVC